MNESVATCAGCGETVQERPLSWSVKVTASGDRWLCAACTRQQLRSIEGRLDEDWR